MIEGDPKEGEVEGRSEYPEIKDLEEERSGSLSVTEILGVLRLLEEHEPGPAAGAGGAPVYRHCWMDDDLGCFRAPIENGKPPEADDILDSKNGFSSW